MSFRTLFKMFLSSLRRPRSAPGILYEEFRYRGGAPQFRGFYSVGKVFILPSANQDAGDLLSHLELKHSDRGETVTFKLNNREITANGLKGQPVSLLKSGLLQVYLYNGAPDIGTYSADHRDKIGREYLVRSDGVLLSALTIPLERRLEIIRAFSGSPSANFSCLTSALSTETQNALRVLRTFAESMFRTAAVAGDAPEDFQVELDRGELEEIVGRGTVEELEAIWYGGTRVRSPKYTRIVVRRCCASGKHINFHTDVSSRTMQVALNGDDEYEGGRLVFLNEHGAHMPKRPEGTVTLHEFDIVHGVTELSSGTRLGLFLLEDSLSRSTSAVQSST